jgi:drug/metabolite transporter (DMT)-like permease
VKICFSRIIEILNNQLKDEIFIYSPVTIMSKIGSKHAALVLLLSTVILNSAGQLFFKATRTAHPNASLISLFYYYETWAGFFLYGLSAVCWLWVLSRTQLSYAYPILALSFPIVVGLSAFFFSETISPLRWVGVGAIVVGVSLIART